MTTRPHRSGRARATIAIIVAAVVAVAPLSTRAQASSPDDCLTSAPIGAGSIAACTGILTAPADALRDAKAYDERDEAQALLAASKRDAADWEFLARGRDELLHTTSAQRDAAVADADAARAARPWWAAGGLAVGILATVAVVVGIGAVTR